MPTTVKNRVFYILKYLWEATDEAHPVSTNDIINYLAQNGIEAGRKTITDDIFQMQECGYDVVCNKSRQNLYFIGSRTFELPELKLLVDAVQAATFISSRKSKPLIKKLTSFASPYQAKELNRRLYVDGRVKTANEKVIYNIDTLYSAISSGKRITFKYRMYTAGKRTVYRHNGKRYEISPYDLVWSHDRYYVLGHSSKDGEIRTYRIDRICDLEVIDSPAERKPSDYIIDGYFKRVFLMYDEEVYTVELLCENDMMDVVIDHFDTKVKTEIVDDKHFKVTVEISVSPTFYAWIFTFAGKIRIISPKEAVCGYKEHFELAARNL